MTAPHSEWIAPTGLRAIDPDATHTMVPLGGMMTAGFSLAAIGLYGEVLSYQGVPINPYANSVDPAEEIRSAVQELIDNGLVVRVDTPTGAP